MVKRVLLEPYNPAPKRVRKWVIGSEDESVAEVSHSLDYGSDSEVDSFTVPVEASYDLQAVLKEIEDGVVRVPKHLAINHLLDSDTASNATVPGLLKGYSVKIMSVNPNGLKTVPILDDEGVGTGKKKEKLQMLKSMCSNHGVDILMWQEGHGYNPATHPTFFSFKPYLCTAGQAGIIVINPELKVVEFVQGTNFVIVKVTIGGVDRNVVSVYLPPGTTRAKQTLKDLKKALKGRSNILALGDYNVTESDDPINTLGGSRDDPMRRHFLKFLEHTHLVDVEQDC